MSASPASERLSHALQRLDALVNWERRDRDASMRMGLGPVAELLAQLGNPQASLRCVHVAGTKGKGTTSAFVEAGLRAAGLASGLYTSPHVSRIHERVRIRGAEIEDEPLARALERALDARERALSAGGAGAAAGEASWFDLLTAAAFLAFAEARVAWAVVECGLGGRLDSTNVVRGEVCVITNIDLEHTRVLGPTRAHIAREKAGILKPGCTLVTGVFPGEEHGQGEDPARVIQRAADALGVRVLRPERPRAEDTLEQRNAALARLVLDELGRRGVRGGEASLSGSLLDAELLAAARLPGRLEERRAGRTRVVLDAAHTPSSVRLVLDELLRAPHGRLPVVILALGRDKDAQGVLKALAGRVDRLLCTTAATGPLVAAETLVQQAQVMGFAAEKADDPAGALARALELAHDDGWVLGIGSFHLAGALRGRTSPDQPQDRATPRC